MTLTVESIHDVPSLPGEYWLWRGEKIYYVKAGKTNPEKPPLLLVHGFGASTDHWRKNIHQLQEKYQVWAIDLLGFGRSAKPPWEYNGMLWQDQLNDFITEVITQPTILAGNSLGGYACLCAGAKGAGNVAGLILINSAGPFSDSRPKNPTFTQKLTRFILSQSWVTFFLFQRLKNKKNIRKTLEQVYLDHSAINDQLIEDIYRPSCDAGALQVFSSVFKNPEGDNIDDLLRQLSCPLLMLWGEKDPWMKTRERGARFKEFCPNLTEFYLEAGHCPHDEIPEKVNQLIDDWIKIKLPQHF
ncbi:MAG: alpha/beta fold hydrolase [Cyanobacterium sp. T60_A2020_053]|nr:alpha/beta fold hydrolase [Cyanobacterium sp. T60_A2020_053]